jgi:hypothetical protein
MKLINVLILLINFYDIFSCENIKDQLQIEFSVITLDMGLWKQLTVENKESSIELVKSNKSNKILEEQNKKLYKSLGDSSNPSSPLKPKTEGKKRFKDVNMICKNTNSDGSLPFYFILPDNKIVKFERERSKYELALDLKVDFIYDKYDNVGNVIIQLLIRFKNSEYIENLLKEFENKSKPKTSDWEISENDNNYGIHYITSQNDKGKQTTNISEKALDNGVLNDAEEQILENIEEENKSQAKPKKSIYSFN